MTESDKEKNVLLESITNYYLQSTDFNGMPCTEVQIPNLITSLVQEGLVTLEFGDRHPNPFTKAFLEEPKETQLKKLETNQSAFFCIYPSREHLSSTVVRNDYEGRPYTLELALGTAQLEYRAFDPSVLEEYRNDPRYIIDVYAFSGWISIKGEFMDTVDEHDSIYLQTFGFARTNDGRPAVAVFVRYLKQLSPEHQQKWYSKRLNQPTEINQNYKLQSEGNWGTQISVPDAILEEISEINKLCELIGKPRLFRETFEDKSLRPRMFGLLLRPTQHEFDKAVQTLDIVLSDNLNYDFFSPEVSREFVEGGEKKMKQSLRMLEEWLDHSYHGPDGETFGRDCFKALRDVRDKRNKPSHKLTADVYDTEYFSKFRKVLESVYNDISIFRMILSKHPYAYAYSEPNGLKRENISHVW